MTEQADTAAPGRPEELSREALDVAQALITARFEARRGDEGPERAMQQAELLRLFGCTDCGTAAIHEADFERARWVCHLVGAMAEAAWRVHNSAWRLTSETVGGWAPDPADSATRAEMLRQIDETFSRVLGAAFAVQPEER